MSCRTRLAMSASELGENILVLIGLVVFCLALQRIPEFPSDPTGNSYYVQQASERIN